MSKIKDYFPDAYPMNGNGKPDMSIKTLYKRESIQTDNPTEDGGLLGSARPSDRSCPEKKPSARGTLARQDIFAVDVLGRRERLDVESMSEAAYQKLLDAARNPIRVDGPMPEMSERPEPAPARLPEWWEVPGETDSAEEVKAILRRNLERATQRKAPGTGSWKRALQVFRL